MKERLSRSVQSGQKIKIKTPNERFLLITRKKSGFYCQHLDSH